MLAFVHKLPCRDDDGVTTKDLSKVSAQYLSAVGHDLKGSSFIEYQWEVCVSTHAYSLIKPLVGSDLNGTAGYNKGL